MKMRKPSFALCAALSAGALLSPCSSSAGEIAVESTVGIYTDYMFRGFNLYDGISFQPSLQASYDLGEAGTLSLQYWMHLSAEGGSSEENFTESDLTVAYETELGPFALTVGNASYLYPIDSDKIRDTSEAFAILAYDAFLSTSLSAWFDYREFDSQYFELSLSRAFDVEERATISPFVSFGFAANSEKLYAENGLVQITEGVAFEFPVGELTLSPSLNYTHKIDEYTTNELWFGTTVTYQF